MLICPLLTNVTILKCNHGHIRSTFSYVACRSITVEFEYPNLPPRWVISVTCSRELDRKFHHQSSARGEHKCPWLAPWQTAVLIEVFVKRNTTQAMDICYNWYICIVNINNNVTFKYTLPEKVMEYMENTMKICVYDILICWKWLGTNHKQASWFLMQLSRVVLRTKYSICIVHNWI